MQKSHLLLIGGVGGLIVGVVLFYVFGAVTARGVESDVDITGNTEYLFALVDPDAEATADVTWTIDLASDTGGGTATGLCSKGTTASIKLGAGNWHVTKLTRMVTSGGTPTATQFDPLTPTKNLVKFDGLFVKTYYVVIVKERTAGDARFITPVGLKTK